LEQKYIMGKTAHLMARKQKRERGQDSGLTILSDVPPRDQKTFH
jgi:hypothetical protein